MTYDNWHVTCDMWHATCDMWHVGEGEGEYSLKISALQLLRFVMDSVLKILNQKISDSMNE